MMRLKSSDIRNIKMSFWTLIVLARPFLDQSSYVMPLHLAMMLCQKNKFSQEEQLLLRKR